MARGANISPREKQDWLGAYESGQTTQRIAQQVRRAPSTVAKGIDQARQEREARSAREGVLRDAYQRHYEDLLQVASQLRDMARSLDVQDLASAQDLRTQMLAEALKAHTKGARLWKTIAILEQAAHKVVSVKQDLKGRLSEKIPEEFPKGVQRDANLQGFIKSLVWAVDQAARKVQTGTVEYRQEKGADGFQLHWGGIVLASALPSAKRQRAVEEVHRRWVTDTVISPERSQLRGLREAQAKAQEELEAHVEAMLLRRVLPGECPLCPHVIGKAPINPRRGRRNK